MDCLFSLTESRGERNFSTNEKTTRRWFFDGSIEVETLSNRGNWLSQSADTETVLSV